MTKLRDARRAKKQSQIAVAEAMGVSESVYQRIERGDGRTTQDEINAALKVVKGMPMGKSSVTGRPYKQSVVEDLDAALEAEEVEDGDVEEEDLLGEPEPEPEPVKPAKKAAAKKSAPRAPRAK